MTAPSALVDFAFETYLCYLLLSLGLTVWVGRSLHKNGLHFLVDALHGDATLAISLNHLLLVGFYLLNFGFVAINLKVSGDLASPRIALETLAGQMGIVLLCLGVLHFFNLYIFSRLRRMKHREALAKDAVYRVQAPA